MLVDGHGSPGHDAPEEGVALQVAFDKVGKVVADFLGAHADQRRLEQRAVAVRAVHVRGVHAAPVVAHAHRLYLLGVGEQRRLDHHVRMGVGEVVDEIGHRVRRVTHHAEHVAGREWCCVCVALLTFVVTAICIRSCGGGGGGCVAVFAVDARHEVGGELVDELLSLVECGVDAPLIGDKDARATVGVHLLCDQRVEEALLLFAAAQLCCCFFFFFFFDTIKCVAADVAAAGVDLVCGCSRWLLCCGLLGGGGGRG